VHARTELAWHCVDDAAPEYNHQHGPPLSQVADKELQCSSTIIAARRFEASRKIVMGYMDIGQLLLLSLLISIIRQINQRTGDLMSGTLWQTHPPVSTPGLASDGKVRRGSGGAPLRIRKPAVQPLRSTSRVVREGLIAAPFEGTRPRQEHAGRSAEHA
jgi:hypothetical protein